MATNSAWTLFEDIFIKDYQYKDIYTKIEIWQALEKIVSGKFKVTKIKNEDLNSFKLDFTYKSIKIRLIETDSKPLKFDFNINLTEHLEFYISIEDNLDKLMKYFGKKDLEILKVDFDKKYFIQTKNKEQVKLLLENEELSDLIIKNNIYGIICNFDKEVGLTKILTVVHRNIETLEEIFNLVKLQTLLIDILYENKLIKK